LQVWCKPFVAGDDYFTLGLKYKHCIGIRQFTGLL
jgi:hypothetical protein